MHAPSRLPLFLLLAAALLPVRAQPIEEVPFITSPDNVTLEMLRVAGVGPTDHVIDLGSGDGRIVILAARRFGASGLGVEIDPNLVRQSQRHARDAGVDGRVTFLEQDLFKTDLAPATVITMYLLPEVNLALRPSVLALKPGTRIVSHDWDMGDWKPDQTTVLPVPDKKVGLEKSSKVHLWVVPARVDGLWCGNGALRGASLQVRQRYQQFDARLVHGGAARDLDGRIQGTTVRGSPQGDAALELQAAGDGLRVIAGSGAFAPLQGQAFSRATGAGCPA
ncbi:MAG TPA: class I SAM-dependent methyltransferase [Ramlibacter sp.]|jgi:SAM-dependent methyltransferase